LSFQEVNVHRKQRGAIVAGLLMILLGGGLLVNQLYPSIGQLILPKSFTWPWFVIGAGLIFFFFALLTGEGGLAIPGSVICTIGGILYYQNTTGDWESWSFVWALIPVSVGLGIIIMSIIDGQIRKASGGLWFIFINLALFVIFWAAFRRDSAVVAKYWPVALIVLGVIFLIQSFIPRRAQKDS
jgi:hypothetical protein